MPKVWISLGSNQKRETALKGAIAALQHHYGRLQISNVYESTAQGFVGAAFYNLIVGCTVEQPLSSVLNTLQTIENSLGRDRSADKFGPRTLDLDLLTWDDQVITQDKIILPRADILQYAFVLRPLAELAGSEVHPVSGQTYQELWQNFDKTSQYLKPVTLDLLVLDGQGLKTEPRSATVVRNTLETKINVALNLDGTGISKFNTGIPFLEHMLDQVARHGSLDLNINCQGDIQIDDHHSVEDIGITLGLAFKQAWGNKTGIYRYGYAYVPLDESLTRVVVDLSGRPGLQFNLEFSRSRIGTFDVDLIREFFQGLVNHAAITLHIDGIRGTNAHHQAETVFKGFGRALRMALTMDKNQALLNTPPSTKGVL